VGTLRAWRVRRGSPGYRGADRRGLIRRFDPVAGIGSALGMAVAVVAAPLVVVGILAATGTDPGAWGTGVADVGFVACAVATVLLVLRWRLMGDAACVWLAGAVMLAGLVLVPVSSHPRTPEEGLLGALWAVAVVSVTLLVFRGVLGPEVRSDLRPDRVLAVAVAVTLAVALPLGLTPSRLVVQSQLGGVGMLDLTEGAVVIVLAGLLFVVAARRRRLLLVAGANLLLAVGAAGVAVGVHVSGPWQDLPSLLFLTAAVEMLVVVGSALQSAVSAVVLYDVGGRRRWEAAESQLTTARTTFQGQSHDVRNMLSAIDGTLLVLSTQRDQLPTADVDHLLAAVRDELQWLRALVGGGDGDPRVYDLSELLAAVVSVRVAGPQQVHCRLEAGLELQGRPDRMAIAVDNLVDNAALYAPDSHVTVATRLTGGPGCQQAEIVVFDDGPGLHDDELMLACERGWRGSNSARRSGSGLGLAQSREMVEAEGGSFSIGHTNPAAPEGQRGLRVEIRMPVHRSVSSESPAV